MTDETKKQLNVLVVHGPNLNLLGSRDKKIYGNLTLDKLNRCIRNTAAGLGMGVSIYQFNSEEKIIRILHRKRKHCDAVIINPAAYTHYSYAIRDAVELLSVPVVEVHLSDISAREDFRKVSVMKDVCLRQIYGKKEHSYTEALRYLQGYLSGKA